MAADQRLRDPLDVIAEICHDQPPDALTKIAEVLGFDEQSPEFTDTARAALLWVLWHHQGGSSEVGQAIRFALGKGGHDRMTKHEITQAKRWASIKAGRRAMDPARVRELAAPTPGVAPVEAPSESGKAGPPWCCEKGEAMNKEICPECAEACAAYSAAAGVPEVPHG